MKNTILKCCFLVGIFCILGNSIYGRNKDEEQIKTMLQAQVSEWNKGNIKGYMKGYWEHDSLIFVGKNGPVYGFNATLARYQKAYPDAKAMGTLTSTILSMKKLSNKYYLIVGRWNLDREAGNLNGVYTLLLKKMDTWVIVYDHSS